MPQPRRDAVHRYFEYFASDKVSKCNLCGNSLKGKHTTNLKNHMSIKHPEEYLMMVNVNKENNAHASTSTSKETVNSDKIKNICVRLVTIHGRPFSLLQDTAFQEMINISVPSNIKTKEINMNAIKSLIPEKAYQIKWKIAMEIKNKMVCLKLDSATYLDRNFLGINLQYIKNGKIIIRNITVLELMERQTGEFLKEKLLEVLNDFMISTSQIYSITTDNGSNFKKMTKLFNEHATAAQYENLDDEYGLNENDDTEEDDAGEQLIDDYIQDDLNIESIVNIMSNDFFKPRDMLCAAHTLQLAVKDAISENITAQVAIQTARKAVKILRQPNMKIILRESNLKKPIIDCTTRWSSTYNMLERLLSLKGTYNNPELMDIFSDDFWTEVNNLVTCLKPINDTTLFLQREQLTISDFYIEWLNCKTKLEAFHTSFSESLVKAMKAREVNLLTKDLVLESLYLDSRINVVLSDEECMKAKTLLCQTYRQIENVRRSEIQGIEFNDVVNTSHEEVAHAHTSELEKILQETETMRNLPRRSSINDFEGVLNKLRFEPRTPLNENILAHWTKKASTTESSLIELVYCVLAAPATQVSVERLFSSVKFILNPLRSNISGNMLKDIMLIRSNSDLFE